MTAEQLARLFHGTYERLAPRFGYATRSASARRWDEVPERNKLLMIATCEAVLQKIADENTPVDANCARCEHPESWHRHNEAEAGLKYPCVGRLGSVAAHPCTCADFLPIFDR